MFPSRAIAARLFTVQGGERDAKLFSHVVSAETNRYQAVCLFQSERQVMGWRNVTRSLYELESLLMIAQG